jgi:hypothetical protein
MSEPFPFLGAAIRTFTFTKVIEFFVSVVTGKFWTVKSEKFSYV